MIASDSFYSFRREMLSRFRGHPRVRSISGPLFPTAVPPTTGALFEVARAATNSISEAKPRLLQTKEET